MDYAQQMFGDFFGPEWGPALFVLAKNALLIVAIILPLMLAVAYLTFAERKIIAYMQMRVGPNRVRCSIAWLGDGDSRSRTRRIVMKEIIIPSERQSFCSCLRRY